MNPGLLRAIHVQMSAKSTEELTQLWVENDRGTYSDETFEAVRSILTERGVQLPRQNDPPPVAEPVPPRHVEIVRNDPVTSFWMEWLRALLWIGAALGLVQVIGWAFLLWWFVHAYWGVGTSFNGTPWEALTEPTGRLLLLDAILAGWLLVGVRMGLVLHPRARGVLIAYAWAEILATVLWIGSNLYTSARDPEYSWVYTASLSADDLRLTLYPVILLLLLSRPQMKTLFEPRNDGFEVTAMNVPAAGSAAEASAEDHP